MLRPRGPHLTLALRWLVAIATALACWTWARSTPAATAPLPALLAPANDATAQFPHPRERLKGASPGRGERRAAAEAASANASADASSLSASGRGASPHAYGTTDSDYRPDRWKNFREDYRFTGKEEDVEVGIVYFGKRYLNTNLGRWISADPLAVHAPGEADLNLYAYVHGQVLKNVDPLGLDGLLSSVAEAVQAYLAPPPAPAPAPPYSAPPAPVPGTAGPTGIPYGTSVPEPGVDSPLEAVGQAIDVAVETAAAYVKGAAEAEARSYLQKVRQDAIDCHKYDIAESIDKTLVELDSAPRTGAEAFGYSSGGALLRLTVAYASGRTSGGMSSGRASTPRAAPGRPTATPQQVGAGVGGAAGGGIRANAAQGAAFEAKVGAELAGRADVVAPQVTVRTASGTRTRIDFVTRDASGTISCVECKSSATAPLTPNQAAAFPEIGQTGATVVGKGKPGIPGGTQIPPTQVEIRRP